MQIPRSEVGHFTDANRAQIWQQITRAKSTILDIADTFKAADNGDADFNSEKGIVVATHLRTKSGTAKGSLIYDPTMDPPPAPKTFRFPFMSAPAPPPRDEKQFTSMDVTSDYHTFSLSRDDHGVRYSQVQKQGTSFVWSEDPCGTIYVEQCGYLYTAPATVPNKES